RHRAARHARAARARRPADGALRRERRVGDRRDVGCAVARARGARRPVGDRVRQRPRVGAQRAPADDDRAADQADGLRRREDPDPPDRRDAAGPRAHAVADAACRARVVPAARGRTLTVVETRDERVEGLLARMTVEEKAAQLGSAWVFQLPRGDDVSPGGAELMRDGLGQVTRISGASSLDAEGAARLANAIQRHLVEETRLGIPAIVHEEICSGLMARQAVVFPQAIGLASTWEPDLAGELADAIRVQMRAVGAHQGLAPGLDVCRDPRWRETEETFGEDPYLVSRFGVAFTRGLQGTSLRSGVVATLKHLVGYGASDGGMNWAPAGIPPRALHEVYLHPFEAAVRVGGARSVMNAYNEIDGLLCAADHALLTGTLRDEWGFDGFVVSDYFSIRQLAGSHRLAGGGESAAALALEAGLDAELPATDCYGAPLLRALEAGLVSEETLDVAVRRVLCTKFELGLFDEPYVDVARSSGAA